MQHHGNRLPGDQALPERHDDVDLEREAQAVDSKARAGEEAWKKRVNYAQNMALFTLDRFSRTERRA